MFLRNHTPKALDYNDGFRDLNGCILSYLSTEDILKTLKDYQRIPVQDAYDLHIRRTIIQHSHKITQKWRDAIDNFIETIIMLKNMEIRCAQITEIELIKIKRAPDPEVTYKDNCELYRDAFLILLKKYFSEKTTLDAELIFQDLRLNFPGNIRTSIHLVKNCIMHLSYSIKGLQMDDYYREIPFEIFRNSECTWHLLRSHPNIQKLSNEATRILVHIFYSGYTSERMEMAKFVISKLSKDYIQKNVTDAYYKPSIKALIIYAYENVKNEKLKNYSDQEVKLLEDFLEEEITKVKTWKNIAFIYEEHHRATYLPFTFEDDLQEKAYEILMRNSEYESIQNCSLECDAALKHPLFLRASEFKKNIQQLSEVLNSTLIRQHGVFRRDNFRMLGELGAKTTKLHGSHDSDDLKPRNNLDKSRGNKRKMISNK